MVRGVGVRIPLRERVELAKKAHWLSERGVPTWRIALTLGVSEPTVINLVGYGRRLAAGQPVVESWR